MKQDKEVKYMGCELDGSGNRGKDLMKRISKPMIVQTKLDQFWLCSNCPIKRKVEVYNAVIKSKLLYGLEPLQLRESLKKNLDTLQLKGLREILKMKTTYVNRNNTK